MSGGGASIIGDISHQNAQGGADTFDAGIGGNNVFNFGSPLRPKTNFVPIVLGVVGVGVLLYFGMKFFRRA